MEYRYIIRKIPTNNGIKYTPIILNKSEWKYLIKSDERYMVSKRTKVGFDSLIEAYRFVAEHRMKKGYKGKDRPKCLFFKEGFSMIPFIGIFYTIPKIIKKVPLKYLFSSPTTLGIASVIQISAIIITIVLI